MVEKEEEENILNKNAKKKIASKIIKQDNINQTNIISAELCDHKLKITILNFLIITIISIIGYRFIIQPYFLNQKTNNALTFHKIIKKYYNKYTSSKNIFLFIIFILIIIVFLSFNVIQLQNIGIILLITFVTAVAEESEEFLLGALLSGITAYIFIRLKTYFNDKNNKLVECDDDIITIIKRKLKGQDK